MLYVTSTAHRVTSAAMRSLYDASSSRHRRFVEYAGGAIGYQLFELDPGLDHGDRRLVRRGAATVSPDVEVAIVAADGWSIGGLLAAGPRQRGARCPAPCSSRRHGTNATPTPRSLPRSLSGVASLRIDMRGRRASRGEMTYADDATPAPACRARCCRPFEHLAVVPGVDPRGSPWAPSRTPPPMRSTPSRERAAGAVVLLSAGWQRVASTPSADGTCRCSGSCRRRTGGPCGQRSTPISPVMCRAPAGWRCSTDSGSARRCSRPVVRAARRRTARGDDRRLARRPPRLTIPPPPPALRSPLRVNAVSGLARVNVASRTRWQISTWYVA